MGPFDAALFLTLIVFCIEFWAEPQLVMLCSFPVIVRPLARSPIYWLCITVVLIGSHWHLWYLAQNHWFLMGYWSLAIALSLFSPSQEQALANSARWILILAFLFSVLWKLTTLEYIDGRFFEYGLLADIRFSPIGLLLGLDSHTLTANRELLNGFVYIADPSGEVVLSTVAGVPVVAHFLTWWLLLVEGAVAVVLLIPRRLISDFWRHAPLIAFLCSTYSLAQVTGFGWILSAMGMCQLNRSTKPLYLGCYLALFPLIFIGKHPGLRGILQYLNILETPITSF
jgi:hypothetical protein